MKNILRTYPWDMNVGLVALVASGLVILNIIGKDKYI